MSIPTPPLDVVHRAILAAFPPLSPEAQQAGLAIYRLLARGSPVRREQLASALNRPTREIVALLSAPAMRGQLLYNDQRCVIGFGGLTLLPSAHRLEVAGQEMFTWCAWDALFVPELIGTTARVESTCPASGETIHLTVTPSTAVATVDPEPVLSFLLPEHEIESTERSISSFCGLVHLLVSEPTGRRWVAERDGVFLLSLADAFELARRRNAARFGGAMTYCHG